MDSALPFAISIGAAVACCVFLIGRVFLQPNANEDAEALIPAHTPTAASPREAELSFERESKEEELESQESPTLDAGEKPSARTTARQTSRGGITAAYVAGGFVGIIALLMVFNLPTPDDLLMTSYQGLAAVHAKMALHDVNAKIENIVFHPMAGEGQHGNSYACGYIKPSTDLYSSPQRFIYYFNLDKFLLFATAAAYDRRLFSQLTEICNAAPFPIATFNFEGGKVSLLTK
jgi:hypothetical protein